MGFLDSLVKKSTRAITNAATSAAANAIGNAVGDAVGNVAQDLLGGARKNGDNNALKSKSVQTESAAKKIEQENVPAGYEAFARDYVDDKLRAILAKEFPQYQVRESVSPTELGGEGQFLSYDFGVYESGQPKLFIMIVSKNTCRSRRYRWSKEQAERAGVTMINFVGSFENRIDYVIDRLHQYL